MVSLLFGNVLLLFRRLHNVIFTAPGAPDFNVEKKITLRNICTRFQRGEKMINDLLFSHLWRQQKSSRRRQRLFGNWTQNPILTLLFGVPARENGLRKIQTWEIRSVNLHCLAIRSVCYYIRWLVPDLHELPARMAQLRQRKMVEELLDVGLFGLGQHYRTSFQVKIFFISPRMVAFVWWKSL